jgi:DNA-damage-inducible protein J
MAAQSSMVHIRIDNALKEQATEALAAMGLTTADAVRLLFHRIVAEQALPLELKVPNAATRAAMAEAAEMMAARKQRFASAKAMIAALDEHS